MKYEVKLGIATRPLDIRLKATRIIGDKNLLLIILSDSNQWFCNRIAIFMKYEGKKFR